MVILSNFVLNIDIAFSSAIKLDNSITVCDGGVCGGVIGGVCGGVSSGDTLPEIFNHFVCVCVNPVVCLCPRLGKSLVLFVRVTLYISSTIAVEMISAVTVIDGDLRQSAILFVILFNEWIIIKLSLKTV